MSPTGREGAGRWFARAVEADRAATRARVHALGSEIAGMVAASTDANTDDEHDPEGATIAFERARSASLLADAEAHLAALDRAENRLLAGTHLVCGRCGGPIARDRVLARPEVTTCFECASRPRGR